MNVRMPDGTVIQNVPDNITQAELLERYQSFGQQTQEQSPSLPKASELAKSFLDKGITSKHAQQVATENLPMIAATAASIMAPQIALPAWAARLGLVGRAISPAVTNAPKIAAAFAGGAAGGSAQEAMREGPNLTSLITGNSKPAPTPASILMAGLESGKDMAISELAGSYIGPMINKVLRPGASAMTPESAEALKLARENNLPISPATVAPSLTTKTIQGALDNFTPSKLVNDAYRKKAVSDFNRIAAELPEKEGVGQVLGNGQIKEQIVGVLDDVLGGKSKGLMGAGKAEREAWLASIGSKGKKTAIDLTSTLPVLKSVKANAVDESLRSVVVTKLDELKRAKSLTAENLDTFMSQIGGTKVKNRADNKFLTEIKEAIKKDFEAAGADMTKLSESGQTFSEAFAATSGKAAKQLKADLAKGQDPTFLTERLYRPESSALLHSVKSRLPKEVSDSLDAQALSNMINNSTKDGPVYGMRVLDGNKLEKILDANMSVLKKNYSASTIQAMQNLVKLAKAGTQDVAKLGTSKGELLTGAATLGGIAKSIAGGTASGTLPIVIGGSIGSMAIASSMMRPNGLVNRWLTTGASDTASKFAQEAARLGIRESYAE